jgi:hypothetical protein
MLRRDLSQECWIDPNGTTAGSYEALHSAQNVPVTPDRRSVALSGGRRVGRSLDSTRVRRRAGVERPKRPASPLDSPRGSRALLRCGWGHNLDDEVDTTDHHRVLESRRFLSEILVWPRPNRLDLDGWVGNFDRGLDQRIALALLEAHIHIDEDQVYYGVASSFRGISSREEFGDEFSRAGAWADFLDRVLVSFPLSRLTDSTASGHIFGRFAEKLGIPENRILGSEHLVARLAQSDPLPVIFFDDLAASGRQFTRNWKRNYPTKAGPASLEQLSEQHRILRAYYLPLVATVEAVSRIESECDVAVIPTYALEDDYRCLDQDTRLVPEELRSHLPEFLEKYTPRTGRNQYGATGYGQLGLALTFHHSCPNNTLPVLQTGPRSEVWSPWSNE